MHDITWSKSDRRIARQAFDKAYQQECGELLAKVREMAAAARGPAELWEIHDLLDDARSQIDQKYDWRYSVLILVFGRLVREGRLTLEDLDGLDEEKIARIETLLSLVS